MPHLQNERESQQAVVSTQRLRLGPEHNHELAQSSTWRPDIQYPLLHQLELSTWSRYSISKDCPRPNCKSSGALPRLQNHVTYAMTTPSHQHYWGRLAT